MRPLIEIQTIPIEIQMKTTNAHLEYARGTAQMEVSRDRRGLQIRSQPIRVNIDTFEARSSIVPTTAQSIQQGAAQGQRAAYEATAVLAQEGRMMMEAKIDQDVIPQLSQQKTVDQPAQLGIQFLPEVGPDISWTGGEMSRERTMGLTIPFSIGLFSFIRIYVAVYSRRRREYDKPL